MAETAVSAGLSVGSVDVGSNVTLTPPTASSTTVNRRVKVNLGSGWIAGVLKRYDGASWVEVPIKNYENGEWTGGIISVDDEFLLAYIPVQDGEAINSVDVGSNITASGVVVLS